jgi:deoxyribonuclease-4
VARRITRIGAHVSVSGGLERAGLARAALVGAEVIQLFVGNPRGWAPPAGDPAGDEAFRVACIERALPVFVHAPYLINLGSSDGDTAVRSAAALAFSLRRGRAIGAAGVVVHAGFALRGERWSTAMTRVRESLIAVVDASDAAGPGGPRLLIEPTAGGGGALAGDIDSIGAYLDAVGDDRIGLCIDTCHLHAAGDDLSTPSAMRRALAMLTSVAGPGRIGLLHLNDSRDAVGSRRDRHAAIGTGTIGLTAFGALLHAGAVRGVPMVVETAESGHAEDIATLKRLREPAHATASS